MKISKIKLLSLHNEEHFQFMTDIKGCVESTDLSALNIDPLIPIFMNLFKQENDALEAFRNSALTDPIAVADTLRDEIYRGFILYIKSYSHSPQNGKASAAHNIQIVIDHYGDFRYKNYSEETATINSFLQDIESHCSGDIVVLNGMEWVTDLSAANKAFNSLMKNRFDENASQVTFNMRETRKEIDKTYIQITNSINNYVSIHSQPDFTELIYRLNSRIEYFKNTLIMRKARSAAKKETEPTVPYN